MHRINLLKARLNGEDLSALTGRPIVALTSTGQSAQGAKTFMQLYSYRLLWEEDVETLKKENAYLEGLLAQAIDKAQNLEWIASWINSSSPGAAVTRKGFWGGSIDAASEIRVEPAFTLVGKAQADGFLLDLESALTNPASIAARKAEFVSWYSRTYVEAWHAFGLASDAAWSALGTSRNGVRLHRRPHRRTACTSSHSSAWPTS